MTRVHPDLVAAINAACAARCDDARNRAALLAEAADFSPEQQQDLIEHFQAEAAAFECRPPGRLRGAPARPP